VTFAVRKLLSIAAVAAFAGSAWAQKTELLV
jgi:hypothetical protein